MSGFLQDIVRIVRRHDRQVQLGAQLHQPLIDGWQFGNVAVFHKLQIVVVEHLFVPAGCGPGLVHPALGDQRRNLAAGATRHDNQVFAVLLQYFPVHPGSIVEPFQVGHGHQLDQVLITAITLCQDCHVVRSFLVGIAFVPTFGSDIHLAADNRFDSGGFCDLVEVDGPVHPAVVGNGEAIHAKIGGAGDEGFQTAQAVQHAVFSVNVQV